MARQITLVAHARTAAEPTAVYRLLEEGRTWPTWSRLGSFRLERAGRGGGEGLGAVRSFRAGLLRSRQEIVELRAGESLRYVIRPGPALKAHQAHVALVSEAGGTLIVWRESFEAGLYGSGWLLRRVRQRFLQSCADGLAAHAARLGKDPGAGARP